MLLLQANPADRLARISHEDAGSGKGGASAPPKKRPQIGFCLAPPRSPEASGLRGGAREGNIWQGAATAGLKPRPSESW